MRNETIKTVAYFFRIVLQKNPRYFVYMFISVLMTAFLPFINIILMQYIIDELLDQRRVDMLFGIVVIFVLGNWILKSLNIIFIRNNTKQNSEFRQYFQEQFVQRCMELDFEHTEDSEVLNQANKAREGMGWYSGGLQGLSDCFKDIFSSFITLCGVIFLIARMSPFLFFILMLIVCGSSYVISRINKLEIKTFNKGPQINRAFWYIHDVLGEARYGYDIRLYGAEEFLMNKGQSALHDLYRLFKELEDGKRKWGGVNAVLTLCESVGIYLYLGYLSITRSITIGQFTMLVSAAITFRTSLQNIIVKIQELEKKAGFMNEHKKFMEYKEVLVKGVKKVQNSQHLEIVFQNVYFRYPGSKDYTLKNINIVIKPGEHLSVVGLNGAGKTTFIKLLCRLYDVTEGAILVGGINIKEYQYDEYMKLLSVIFQDYKLFAMSIKDNINLGDSEKESENIGDLCKISGLKEKVDSLPLGLDTMIYKKFSKEGIEPSGGEAQKIAIARAIFKDSPIIVLDEPTAALDPVAEYEIYRQFDQLVGGKTAIYISHRLSSCKFCDKIVVFAQQTIVEYGTHDELVKLQGGIYAKMFAAQAKYYL